jgi:hypothetical protein
MGRLMVFHGVILSFIWQWSSMTFLVGMLG